MSELLAYILLFLSAFGAATLLPFYSEVALIALLADDYLPWLVWLTATAGNTLGAVVNWWMGKGIAFFESKPWFPFKQKSMLRAEGWFQRYGKWSLLMAWLPIGGDALTLIAGVFRVPFLPFICLVTIGKGARYAVVMAIYFGLF